MILVQHDWRNAYLRITGENTRRVSKPNTVKTRNACNEKGKAPDDNTTVMLYRLECKDGFPWEHTIHLQHTSKTKKRGNIYAKDQLSPFPQHRLVWPVVILHNIKGEISRSCQGKYPLSPSNHISFSKYLFTAGWTETIENGKAYIMTKPWSAATNQVSIMLQGHWHQCNKQAGKT